MLFVGTLLTSVPCLFLLTKDVLGSIIIPKGMIDLKRIKFLTIPLLCAAVLLSSCNGNKKLPRNEEKNVLQQEVNEEKQAENVLGFENADFLKAVAQCFDKQASELTIDDVLAVRYLAIGPELDGTNTVYVGLDDYAEVYFSPDVTIEALEKYVKTAELQSIDGGFEDLARFENVQVFEYYNIPITDVSFVKNYKNLAFGYFQNNGITDVSSLEGYNPETLYNLDFTGNEISDWSALYDIKDKVIVNYTLQKMQDENGNEVDVPFVTTLEDLLMDEAEGTQSTVTQPDGSEGQSEQPSMVQDDEQSEIIYSDIDWSALFGE